MDVALQSQITRFDTDKSCVTGDDDILMIFSEDLYPNLVDINFVLIFKVISVSSRQNPLFFPTLNFGKSNFLHFPLFFRGNGNGWRHWRFYGPEGQMQAEN